MTMLMEKYRGGTTDTKVNTKGMTVEDKYKPYQSKISAPPPVPRRCMQVEVFLKI